MTHLRHRRLPNRHRGAIPFCSFYFLPTRSVMNSGARPTSSLFKAWVLTFSRSRGSPLRSVSISLSSARGDRCAGFRPRLLLLCGCSLSWTVYSLAFLKARNLPVRPHPTLWRAFPAYRQRRLTKGDTVYSGKHNSDYERAIHLRG
jgi:hypothetical protein